MSPKTIIQILLNLKFYLIQNKAEPAHHYSIALACMLGQV